MWYGLWPGSYGLWPGPFDEQDASAGRLTLATMMCQHTYLVSAAVELHKQIVKVCSEHKNT